jgi:hypothetical protein
MFRKYKNPRQRSGQSTVEYIILVTAVIGAIILFMNGPNSIFQQKVNGTLDTTTTIMSSKATALEATHSVKPTYTAPSQVKVDPAATPNLSHM